MATQDYIFGDKLPASVETTLKLRSKAAPYKKWRNARRPWMKLQSFSNKGQTMIAGDTSVWGIKERYKKDGSTGLRMPMPSLTSIDVKSVGELGSLRKSTIKFQVFGFHQLRDIQPAFLVPGMSVLATWGWTNKPDDTTTSQKIDVSGEKSHAAVQKKIQEKALQEDYCFDGICGVVSTFDWDKQTSGVSQVIDCTITVESMGVAFLNASCNQPSPKSCGCTCTSEDGKEKTPVGGWVKQALFNVAKAGMDAQSEKQGNGIWKAGGNTVGCFIDLDQDT